MEKDPFEEDRARSERFRRHRKIMNASRELYWEMCEAERKTAGQVDAVLSRAWERPNVGPEGRISTMEGYYPEDDPHY